MMLARASAPPGWHEPPRGGFGPAALFALAWARWPIVAAIVVACAAASFLYSTLVLAKEPVFKAAATLDIAPSQAQLDYANAFARGSALQSAGLITQTYAEYATSRPVIESIAEGYLARNPGALTRQPTGLGIRRTLRVLDQGGPAIRDPRLLFIDNLRKSIDVATVDGTHLLRIQVGWDNPVTAAAIANEVADRLIREAAERSSGPTADLNQTLTQRLAEARGLLNQRQIEAARTRASLGVADIQRQKQTLIEEKLAEESRLTNERAQIASSATQVGALQRQSDGLLSSATPAIEQALSLERPRLAGLQQSVRQRAARVGQLGARLGQLSQAETRLGVLDREIEGLQLHVAALTERANTVQLDTLAGAPPIRVVERATPPLVRDSPRVVANTVLGGLAGCALAGLFLLAAPRRPRPLAAAAPRRPAPFEGRIYEGALGPPSGGRRFTGEESRAIRSRLAELLAVPLATPARALHVLAADRDADAVAVFNLIAAFLKARGEAVNADGEIAEGDQLVRTRARPLIYCGGLRETGRMPPATGGDEDLVLVAPRTTAPAALDALEQAAAEAGWAGPYLILLDH
jgi:uncharacterized protein involved in exopolysaccharide biosynthesis